MFLDKIKFAALLAAVMLLVGSHAAGAAGCKRLDKSEPWNQPAPTAVHRDSAALSNFLWNSGSDRPGNFNMLPSYAVFVARQADSSYSITSTLGNLNNKKADFRDLWKPYNFDKQIIVLGTDPEYNYEYFGASVDMAGATVRATRAEYFAVDNTDQSGNAGHFASRGIGIAYVHMLILDCETRTGVINHALSLRVARPRCNEAWWPATKIENHPQCVTGGNPEGARFVADLTQAQIDKWAAGLYAKGGAPLETFGRAVAAALKAYGFYITDNGGSTAGFDMQAIETLSPTNALKYVALEHPTYIRDLLDGLLTPTSLHAVAEQGRRLTN